MRTPRVKIFGMAFWTRCNDVVPARSAASSEVRWDFVPIAVCISLQERMDRTVAAAEEFARVGLSQKVVFYRPPKDTEDGKRGCYTSHREVCLWARRRNLPWILIFEDDVVFDGDPSRLSSALVNAERSLDRLSSEIWHVLHLGHLPYLMSPVHPGLFRTLSTCAHAYFASRRFMDWMLDRPFRSFTRGLDFYMLWCCRTFAVHPMIAYQRPMGSDIHHSLPVTERFNSRSSLRAAELVQLPTARTFAFLFAIALLATFLCVISRRRAMSRV